ncbi:glycosyltransferase, partial [Acinetobacter bereziniae]
DINTNVSNEASDSLIAKGAFSKQNLITVYNGIDLEKFNKSNIVNHTNNSEIKFLSVGRFNEQKDYPNLLNAIALLKDKLNKNIKFYIAGDGELRSAIENLIRELEIINFVELLGKRTDIPDLLNEAKFFILSSKHEGLPTVVIEAMACQTYVISTNCGGSAEIMGSTGKLIPIQDSVALSEAIYEVLTLSDLSIEENNLNARKRVEDIFSLQVSVERWLEIYEK